MQLSANN